MTKPTPAQIAALFGCTPDQVRAQFTKNAAQLDSLASKASAKSKKVNGYTAAQLRQLADAARASAAM
jgi:hypothetical protein